MKYVIRQISLFLILAVLPLSSFARIDSVASAINDKLLQMFPIVIPNATEEAHNAAMQELLGTQGPLLSYPAFPRTWVDLSLVKTQETNTNFSFSTSVLAKSLPIISDIPFLKLAVKAGVGVDYNISYRYSQTSTFMGMTSLRKLKPEATANENKPYPLTSAGTPKSVLRSIVDWDPQGQRTYFKVDKDYPMLGLCKFDMTLAISKTKTGTVDFLIGSRSESDDETQIYSYAVYSNFFQIEAHVPIQDYLRIKCKEHFEYAVRYIAETDFNKFIAEFFAHYHPKATCELPGVTLDPKGDATCMTWFNNPFNVAGIYRKGSVPRCVQNSFGIPVCVIRAKEENRCPLYWQDGELVDRKPGRTFDYFNYASRDDTAAFYCDKGLKCLPPSGKTENYSTGLGEKLYGIDSRCRK